jgi:glutathione-specific gamma-glutamylcyclotransferase
MAEERWVFAYGSLIWNPGFEFESCVPAKLRGYHRKLCVYSFHYRGNPDTPGLVFGLDRGGSCQGVAYRIAAANWPAVHHYLTKRELITDVYREVVKPVSLSGDGRTVQALTYVVDHAHPECAHSLRDDIVLQMVRQGHGEAGRNIDYVRATHRKLAELGIRDDNLERIAALLGT